VPDNIVLPPFPAYSPELNPMENVWEFLCANKLSARVWDSYEAITEACADAWNWFIDDPDSIRSIGTRDWGNGQSLEPLVLRAIDLGLGRPVTANSCNGKQVATVGSTR
jgi:hypothetical protein